MDTAGTLVKTADALLERAQPRSTPAPRIRCFRGRRSNVSQDSDLEELVVTNSIPLSEEAQKVEKIKVLSIAGLLAATIEKHPYGNQRQHVVQLMADLSR